MLFMRLLMMKSQEDSINELERKLADANTQMGELQTAINNEAVARREDISDIQVALSAMRSDLMTLSTTLATHNHQDVLVQLDAMSATLASLPTDVQAVADVQTEIDSMKVSIQNVRSDLMAEINTMKRDYNNRLAAIDVDLITLKAQAQQHHADIATMERIENQVMALNEKTGKLTHEMITIGAWGHDTRLQRSKTANMLNNVVQALEADGSMRGKHHNRNVYRQKRYAWRIAHGTMNDPPVGGIPSMQF